MGKTRDLFKKIRDTKETFYSKMGSKKDRSGRDLTEAEDIKKRWQEYTEELYKKDLHDPDNHDGVIIWVVKLFFVKFFCVFLPPLINILCFCEVNTISVFYRAHLCMKCSLGISNFLEKISSQIGRAHV